MDSVADLVEKLCIGYQPQYIHLISHLHQATENYFAFSLLYFSLQFLYNFIVIYLITLETFFRKERRLAASSVFDTNPGL